MTACVITRMMVGCLLRGVCPVVKSRICPGLDDGGVIKHICCSPKQIDEKTGRIKPELVIL